jgi:hypothetical protein
MRIGERPPDYYFELLSGGPALQSAPRRPIAVDSKLHPPHHHTTAHVWVCTCTVVVGTAFLLPGCLAASDHRRRPVFPVVLCLPCLALSCSICLVLLQTMQAPASVPLTLSITTTTHRTAGTPAVSPSRPHFHGSNGVCMCVQEAMRWTCPMGAAAPARAYPIC